jgi:deoxyribodipyrimidine photo-lyase
MKGCAIPPSLLWLRTDLRVSDHPALLAAIADGPVIPVYILDEETPGQRHIGAAQRWWLHHSLAALDLSMRKRGSALILRRGTARDQLLDLVRETKCERIHATIAYEPWHAETEDCVAREVDLKLHSGNCLSEPDSIRNGQGERYRVFSPWYRKLLDRMPPAPPVPPPDRIPSPDRLPLSDALDSWNLTPTSPNWAAGFDAWTPGEKGAWRSVERWLPYAGCYKTDRDFPSRPATSRLSPHLHFGEITPRALWHALGDRSDAGAESFRSELGWREHGVNLIDQLPHYADRNGRSLFDRLEWRAGSEADADFAAWTSGQTGYPIVDAAMRELWQTGWMHNRLRMVVASFLVKHLLIDWRRGERWFWDTLLDADLGSNAMNWQYVAGTGVDAPVFSRIMSPLLQCERFAMADYVRTYVPEVAHLTDAEIVRAHGQDCRVPGYPQPLVGHEAARFRALDAWQALQDDRQSRASATL